MRMDADGKTRAGPFLTVEENKMIRKLRKQRDDQQWMLDLALNMRGRVQNFEADATELPPGKRARNYRMIPKIWREDAERHEALAKRAHALRQSDGASALRSCDRSLSDGATPDFLRRPPG